MTSVTSYYPYIMHMSLFITFGIKPGCVCERSYDDRTVYLARRFGPIICESYI